MINPLMCLTGQDRLAAVEEHFISLHNPNKRGTDYFLLGRQTVCYFIRKKILNRELTGCFPGGLSTTKKGTSAVYTTCGQQLAAWTLAAYTYCQKLTTDNELGLTSI